MIDEKEEQFEKIRRRIEIINGQVQMIGLKAKELAKENRLEKIRSAIKNPQE